VVGYGPVSFWVFQGLCPSSGDFKGADDDNDTWKKERSVILFFCPEHHTSILIYSINKASKKELI
jgi:hypothetical protein